MIELLLLLVPIAVLLGGWHLAGKSDVEEDFTNPTKPKNFPRDYFVGLNYLLNEQPDKAVDVFIKMIEVDSETVETHLALGNLFRRRGEVERAIRIHQNLIARPHLGKQYRTQAMLELGQDYLRAGVFDRAERLFLEVIEMGGETKPSLQYLLTIYQQEKDWEQAIKVAQQLERTGTQEMHPVIAHYYCEMAEKALAKNSPEQAQKYLKRVLSIDRHCVRASLLEGQMEMKQSRYKQAIRCFKRVKTQDAEFISEAIPPMVQCYEQLNDEDGLVDYLRQCLDETPRLSVILIFSDFIKRRQDNKAVTEFLTEQLTTRPSIRGLKYLIDVHLEAATGTARENLQLIQQLTSQLLLTKPIYQCRHCGFSGKTLQWQCPSCKHWNTVKPIQGLEGD